MKGEQVVVERRQQTGTNAHNQPQYSWVQETVDNVLVAPGALEDVDQAGRPDGVTVDWSLIWPKTYTASLRGCRVLVRDDPEPFDIIGDPRAYPDGLTPTMWNRPSEVTRTAG